MPYTPPSAHSPAASRSESPSISRSHSYLKEHNQKSESPSTNGATRPGLPRSASSASYLHKHRRSPSFTKPQSQVSISPDENSPVSNGNSTVERTERSKLDANGSLRRSPPPVNDSLMPIGAIATPPESNHNSSDDEENSRKGNGRQLENLEELQAAIRIIEQHRESSPTRGSEKTSKAKMALELIVPQLKASLAGQDHDPNRLPLSKEARRISHSRSNTESSILAEMARQVESPVRTSDSDADEDEQDGDGPGKPPMLRKKSGELVRPALRPASTKRRPSSMPGTPTYSKAVHFDSHLEHVRHFLQVDKPLAVSAGSSPVESYESEIEFPFGPEEPQRSRGQPFEWEIKLSNFPHETQERKLAPVCVERVFLSSDNKHLVGVVAVANISFSKHVGARFTLDYWKTTSEVVAEYNNDVRRTEANDGRDRFNFTIKLADLAHLENKTMFICVRYNVDGREFWDNNNAMNYQVDFSKKAKPQCGKNGMPGLAARPLNALPRSRPSPPVPGRPKMSTSFDDFSTGTFDSFGPYQQSPRKLMGESPIRLKKSSDDILPDAPTRKSGGSGQAFSNRYDFGASLSAAIQAANTALGDRSCLTPRQEKPEVKQTYREIASTSRSSIPSSGPVPGPYATPTPTTTPAQKAPAVIQDVTAAGTDSRGRTPGAKPVPGTTSSGASASRGAPLFSDKPALSSQSYQELVDKYCFFGSAKTSPQLTKPTLGLDGANDDCASVSDVHIGSVKTSGHVTPSEEVPAPPSEKKELPRSISPRLNRSASPIPATGSGLGSRSTSPISFGYPYLQSMQNGFFPESTTPTATYG